MTLLILIVLAVCAYLAAAGFMYLYQDEMLFPGSGSQPAALPRNVLRLTATAADGSLLQGVHVPRAEMPANGGSVILGFGGNAWNADAAAAYLHEIFPGRDVVVFHFRGYRPSGGHTSAAGLLADAPLLFDLVKVRFPGRPIIVTGFSIGSGVAAHLARLRNPAGLILVTPFDSLEKVAGDQVGWLPVSLLLRHRMNPSADLNGASVPVAIIAAENDRLIRKERTDALRAAAGANLVFDSSIGAAGHNDIYQNAAFRRSLKEAIGRLEALQRPQ